MFDIIIVGAGGFGREVRQWARQLLVGPNYHFRGFIDDDPDIDESILGSRVLGSIRSSKNQYDIQNSDRFIYAIGNVDNKRSIVEGLQQRGAKFISLIHPTAVIAETATLGEGVVVCPFALVSDRAVISDFAMINFYASCAHDTQVGKYAILSPYATLNGYVELEDEVFLGTHATVTASCKIGCRTKISANSLAMADIPSNSIVFGVPGKHKRIFF
jgi:sugar O-acyltransferase (sialic acid O-acetyltransferase NeuD family)